MGGGRDGAGKGKIHDCNLGILQRCTKSQLWRQPKHSATKLSEAPAEEPGNFYMFKQINTPNRLHEIRSSTGLLGFWKPHTCELRSQEGSNIFVWGGEAEEALMFAYQQFL